VRHSSFIERTLGETRRRVKVIGRLPGEHSCLKLVWAVLDRASTDWRGFTMTPPGCGCCRAYAGRCTTRLPHCRIGCMFVSERDLRQATFAPLPGRHLLVPSHPRYVNALERRQPARGRRWSRWAQPLTHRQQHCPASGHVLSFTIASPVPRLSSSWDTSSSRLVRGISRASPGGRTSGSDGSQRAYDIGSRPRGLANGSVPSSDWG
jgi:hypothetical protein